LDVQFEFDVVRVECIDIQLFAEVASDEIARGAGCVDGNGER
jgi:hypothetical protein